MLSIFYFPDCMLCHRNNYTALPSLRFKNIPRITHLFNKHPTARTVEENANHKYHPDFFALSLDFDR